MKITNEMIKALKPCDDRFNNYLKFYAKKEHTKAQFMGLKNISQSDKLWVAFRLMPKENIALAAADIAESVLSIFEAEYPNDNRPRQAIEAARSGDTAAANAAYTSANAAANAAYTSANAAANAAYYAAAYAANAAANAAYAAANAAYYAAAYAAACAAQSKPGQEKLIRKICLKYWK